MDDRRTLSTVSVKLLDNFILNFHGLETNFHIYELNWLNNWFCLLNRIFIREPEAETETLVIQKIKREGFSWETDFFALADYAERVKNLPAAIEKFKELIKK
jgi:hypothetical protein